ncbi:MAG: tRNA (adenosine(37)-N6)-dimethylallyltransferase MiaA [Succinivibrio sp.]|jgi:tRNA dimethylallyltransferase|nr:tRNA (adenosine(37)-N6)-dimethylallyltransferase MiaA [Succinivibrio sp.]
MSTERALIILGPTATGKTSLALELAAKIPCEIISLDSALVYRGMDIGTAKPTAAERAACPHHLIDIIDPSESYSAAQFRSDCVRLVGEICARGRLPVICGGTMMYYKALSDGLSPLPPTDLKVRALIAARAQELGWPALHAELERKDPVTASRLSPNDRQRISRALEVYEMTGTPMSAFFAGRGDQCPFLREEIVLMPEQSREKLRVQIRARFLKMLDDGLLDEVVSLRARGDLSPDLPSMRAVGYRQCWEYLDGKLSYEEMTERAVIATAHLAKHQMTWLRGALAHSGGIRRVCMAPGDGANAARALAMARDLLA